MNTRKLGLIALGGWLLAACGSGNPSESVASDEESIIRSTSLGGRNEVVMVYGLVGFDAQGTPQFRTCSGAYFAPRVVLTAAHCLQGIISNQLFVYWGDNFATDIAQLTPQGAFRAPPPVGQPSFWAQAESFEQHPQWDASKFYVDMGAIYLDRKPPFDPLPLARFRLDNSWLNRSVTISGWGGDHATSGTTATGARVQRTGTSRILGSPTQADYHPEDPNPGLLDAAARQNIVKIDGHAPYSNTCFGDSGGPLLVTQNGQTYIAGIDYFGGLYCEDYALYTRIDPFLPFVDEAYKKGGQETLTPRLECITPRTGGGFRAYFGYDNKNGIAVDIPYGTKNSLTGDTTNLRPNHFLPGNKPYVFGLNFTANQTLSYRLTAPSGPNTLLTVNSNSPRCNVNDHQFVCVQSCEAQAQANCGWDVAGCAADCLSNYEFLTPCEDKWSDYQRCLAGLSASAFVCDDIFAIDANGVCNPKLDDLFTCLGG
jgi:hypothetical protein